MLWGDIQPAGPIKASKSFSAGLNIKYTGAAPHCLFSACHDIHLVLLLQLLYSVIPMVFQLACFDTAGSCSPSVEGTRSPIRSAVPRPANSLIRGYLNSSIKVWRLFLLNLKNLLVNHHLGAASLICGWVTARSRRNTRENLRWEAEMRRRPPRRSASSVTHNASSQMFISPLFFSLFHPLLG